MISFFLLFLVFAIFLFSCLLLLFYFLFYLLCSFLDESIKLSVVWTGLIFCCIIASMLLCENMISTEWNLTKSTFYRSNRRYFLFAFVAFILFRLICLKLRKELINILFILLLSLLFLWLFSFFVFILFFWLLWLLFLFNNILYFFLLLFWFLLFNLRLRRFNKSLQSIAKFTLSNIFQFVFFELFF